MNAADMAVVADVLARAERGELVARPEVCEHCALELPPGTARGCARCVATVCGTCGPAHLCDPATLALMGQSITADEAHALAVASVELRAALQVLREVLGAAEPGWVGGTDAQRSRIYADGITDALRIVRGAL